MNIRDLFLGAIGIAAIVVIGVTHMTVSFIFTGEFFPND